MPDIITKFRGGLPRRLQQVAPNEYAEEIYVHDAWTAGVGTGKAYLLSTGRMALGQAGVVRAVVANPATASDTAVIAGIAAFVTSDGWVDILRNPTGGLPTTQRFSFDINPYAGTGPIALLFADTGLAGEGLTGGAERETVTGLPGKQRTVISPLGIPLAPGDSFGIQADFAAQTDIVITLYMVEE